jgi:hypothetical protein
MLPSLPYHPPQARTLPQTPFLAQHPPAFTHPPSAPPMTTPTHHEIMLAVMRALTPAHSMYKNAWAIAVQSVHAEIWHMHQNFVTEKEADMHACAKLTSELHRAWHEHKLAAKEQARLDAELMKVVSGCVTLKTRMPGVVTQALRRGLEQLADGCSGECSGTVRASSELKICSPAHFAKISGRIDADLQDCISKCKSFAFPGLAAPQLTFLLHFSVF